KNEVLEAKSDGNSKDIQIPFHSPRTSCSLRSMWFWSNPFCHYTKTDRILTQLPAGCKSQQMQILIQPTSPNMQYRQCGRTGVFCRNPPYPPLPKGGNIPALADSFCAV